MTRVERVLMVTTAILAALAAVGWYSNVRAGAPVSESLAGTARDVGAAPPESIDVAAARVAETDPFRIERKPAAVAYRPDLEGVAPPPKPPKPQLVLEGLVGGAALIDGAPGHPATAIVHVGDTLGGLRIRRIDRDTVIVSGSDTTWRLTLRHAWQ
jgi:hypothetical protein